MMVDPTYLGQCVGWGVGCVGGWGGVCVGVVVVVVVVCVGVVVWVGGGVCVCGCVVGCGVCVWGGGGEFGGGGGGGGGGDDMAMPECPRALVRRGRPRSQRVGRGALPQRQPRHARAGWHAVCAHQRDLHHASASCARLNPVERARSAYSAAAAIERSQW